MMTLDRWVGCVWKEMALDQHVACAASCEAQKVEAAECRFGVEELGIGLGGLDECLTCLEETVLWQELVELRVVLDRMRLIHDDHALVCLKMVHLVADDPQLATMVSAQNHPGVRNHEVAEQ